MSKDYPFPIPEATQKALSEDLSKTFPPWAALEDWPNAPGDPQMLAYFHWWHHDTSALVETLQNCALQMTSGSDLLVEQTTEEKAIGPLVTALVLRFAQFDGLLNWASLTWRHDPRIRAAFRTEPETKEEPPGEAETAAVPVEDTTAGNSPEEMTDQHRLPYSLPPHVMKRVKPIVDRLQAIDSQYLPLGSGAGSDPHFLELMGNIDIDLENIILALGAAVGYVVCNSDGVGIYVENR